LGEICDIHIGVMGNGQEKASPASEKQYKLDMKVKN